MHAQCTAALGARSHRSRSRGHLRPGLDQRAGSHRVRSVGRDRGHREERPPGEVGCRAARRRRGEDPGGPRGARRLRDPRPRAPAGSKREPSKRVAVGGRRLAGPRYSHPRHRAPKRNQEHPTCAACQRQRRPTARAHRSPVRARPSQGPLQRTKSDDRAARARAFALLLRLGDEEASNRAERAGELHPPAPSADTPPAARTTETEHGMGIGVGQCLVCHYERTADVAAEEAEKLIYQLRDQRLMRLGSEVGVRGHAAQPVGPPVSRAADHARRPPASTLAFTQLRNISTRQEKMFFPLSNSYLGTRLQSHSESSSPCCWLTTREVVQCEVGYRAVPDPLVKAVAGGVGQVREQNDLCRTRGQRGPAHFDRRCTRVTAAA